MDNPLHILSHPLSYSDLFLLLCFFFSLIFIWKKVHGSKTDGKLPPGPPMLPIIGNIHQLGGGLPHHALRDISNQYGPLVHLKLGQVPWLVVSSAEMAREVLVKRDLAFADRPTRLALEIVWCNEHDMSFSPYNKHWKQFRKICLLELLSKDNVRSFHHIREDEIRKLTNKIRSDLGKPVNLTDLIFAFSFSVICRAAFGSVRDNNLKMIKGFKQSLHLAGGFYLADLFPSFKFLATISGLEGKLVKIHKEFDNIFNDVLNQHKLNRQNGRKGNAETGDEDLMDVLLRHKEIGDLEIPITDEHVKAVTFDIITGRTDTSAAVVIWVICELIRHPEIMLKVQKEIRQVCKADKTVDEADIQKMSYMKLVIKETLRLHPATPILPRACGQDCEVNGYKISNNTQLALNVWAIARDPKYWEDPESFRPERFEQVSINFKGTDFQYIPFGAGRRMCPGMGFGLASVEIMLAHLLFHFNWSLPDGMMPRNLDMEEQFGLAMRRKNDLHLVPDASGPKGSGRITITKVSSKNLQDKQGVRDHGGGFPP